MEADTDLKMTVTRAGWLGIVSGLCFAVAVAILAFTTMAPTLRLFAAVASAYAGLWLRHLDRRRLPRRCDTSGDLARLATDQNRGRLVRTGPPPTAPERQRAVMGKGVRVRGEHG